MCPKKSRVKKNPLQSKCTAVLFIYLCRIGVPRPETWFELAWFGATLPPSPPLLLLLLPRSQHSARGTEGDPYYYYYYTVYTWHADRPIWGVRPGGEREREREKQKSAGRSSPSSTRFHFSGFASLIFSFHEHQAKIKSKKFPIRQKAINILFSFSSLFYAPIRLSEIIFNFFLNIIWGLTITFYSNLVLS